MKSDAQSYVPLAPKGANVWNGHFRETVAYTLMNENWFELVFMLLKGLKVLELVLICSS